MKKKIILTIVNIGLCLSLFACADSNDTPVRGSVSETESAPADTVEITLPETFENVTSEPESEKETAPADFVPFVSENTVFETEKGIFSYRVVHTEIVRGGYNSLEITVTRKEASGTYVYEGSSTFANPYIYLKYIGADGEITDVTQVISTEDDITREFLPGEVIVENVKFYIPMDAPSGYYGITLFHEPTDAVWIENVFFLE